MSADDYIMKRKNFAYVLKYLRREERTWNVRQLRLGPILYTDIGNYL